MKYDRNLVATIIENEFWDDLYNEIDDSVMNMEGQELMKRLRHMLTMQNWIK